MNGHDFILFYEEFAISKLINHFKLDLDVDSITHVSKIDPSSPYDIDINGIFYDVKVSNPVIVYKGRKPIWDFDLRQTGWEKGKNKKKIKQLYCDYFLLIGMIRGLPNSVFLIPSSIVNKYQHIRISINGESKYYRYRI